MSRHSNSASQKVERHRTSACRAWVGPGGKAAAGQEQFSDTNSKEIWRRKAAEEVVSLNQMRCEYGKYVGKDLRLDFF